MNHTTSEHDMKNLIGVAWPLNFTRSFRKADQKSITSLWILQSGMRDSIAYLIPTYPMADSQIFSLKKLIIKNIYKFKKKTLIRKYPGLHIAKNREPATFLPNVKGIQLYPLPFYDKVNTVLENVVNLFLVYLD